MGEIKGYIVSLKQKLKTGAMGTIRPQGVIVVVTVRTGDHTPYGIGTQKAWHLEVHPGRCHRVKRWIRKVKLQAGVELI